MGALTVVSFTRALVREMARDNEMSEADLLERWSERAAIREYDGGMSRADAEYAALLDVRLFAVTR